MLNYQRPIVRVVVEFENGETLELKEFDQGWIRNETRRFQKGGKVLQEFFQWDIRLTRAKVDRTPHST